MAKIENSDLKVVSGRVSKIFYYNGDNGWASFVMTFSPQKNKLNIGKNSVKCSGIIPDIKVGDKLTVQGRLEDTKYGLQLNVTEFKDNNMVTESSSAEEILAFLSSGCVKGVGPRTALKIFEKYGEESINIIENDYEKLAEIEGIGKRKAKKIHANFNLETGVRKIVSALMPYGISPNLAFKLYNKWGINAVENVKANPYLMADPELGIDGIGFKKADEVASRIGIDKHSPLRLQSLIVYLLVHGSMDGNIFYTYEELLKIGEEYLAGISANEIIENLNVLERGGKIIIEENRIYAISMYLKEKFNAEKLVVLNQAILKDCVLDFNRIQKGVGEHIVYDESQKEAIKTASLDTTGVMVLTGGPGSGKTTVTKGIIEMFKHSGYRILCAAPTGRAAKRMQEATGHKASTIHRLLGCKGANVFDKNEQNPLRCDALIIDEASMIDNNLLYRLLLAVNEGTKLLFIGDIDQLPSIGAGNILRDMISSEFFSVVQLKKIHRQGQESLIISNAHAINEGRNIQIKNTEDSDCIFVDVDQMGESENVVNEIVSLVTKTIPQKYGYDPKEIQVLVPMKKTPLGVNTINDALQKALNTSKEKVATKQATYFVGDKVMQIRNNPEKNVFNGDIGFIKEINDEDKEIIVSFPDNDADAADMFFDVVYDFRELDEIVLAYACTIHKSQGSEYPAVIMVVSYQHYIMLQRNLIYTGITRAKRLCFILGTNKAIYHASNNVPVQKRNTTLIKRIYEFIESLDDENFGDEYEEYNANEIDEKVAKKEEVFQFSYLED